MKEDEDLVKAAVVRFYDALEQLLTGKGTRAMAEAWHHTPRVTSGHPMGEWATGWDEVWATWQEIGAVGKPANAGTKIVNLNAYVYGDTAYTTCVFHAPPAFGGARMNVTNILHREGGVWKIVHHHPDRTPSVEVALDQLAQEG